MTYITAAQAAQAWGISVRRVQKYCALGRIPGACKFGSSWQIPQDAPRPADTRRRGNSPAGKAAPTPGASAQKTPPTPGGAAPQAAPGALSAGLSAGQAGPGQGEAGALPQAAFAGAGEGHPTLMPLMNTPFLPGQCRQAIEALPAGPGQEIARAEYCYFSGQAEQAARLAERCLNHPDRDARFSALLIYAYANLTLGRIPQARQALARLQASLTQKGQPSPAAAFAGVAAAVLLHLPLPDELPPAGDFLPLLPPGLRAFALYVLAHYLYLKQEYQRSLGLAEATLAMGAERYPIPAIYLHLVAVMDLMSLRRQQAAQRHLLTAWEMARPDDLIEGFGEHHGLLGGMLEAVIKPRWPEDFDRIIDITYRFSAGWRRVHNPDTGDSVADDLTTTEFAIAMLAARGWTNREIAGHLMLSPHTVKRYISVVMEKLGVERRQDIKAFMLA